MNVARRVCVVLGALLITGAGARAQSFDRDPATLLQAIGKLSGSGERRASFIEIKTSALLNAPLESRGTLVFRAPDVLEKITTSPQRERVRIEGGTLTLEGAPVRGQAQRRVLALADVPLLAPLAESLRATLAGDLAALQRHYEVALVRERRRFSDHTAKVALRDAAAARLAQALADQSAWTLALSPRDAALRGTVERVLMHGIDAEIGLVEFVEVAGDRTELWITPIR
jgi:hypothetical protein